MPDSQADDQDSSQTTQVLFEDGSSTEISLFPTSAPNAPALLLLPAMGVRAAYYEILCDVLAEEGFNVALADLRGSGGSSVRASRRTSFGYAEIVELELPAIVDSVCQKFGTEQVVVAGHSLGGQLGALFGATSARVSHVVVIASGSAWYRKVPGLRGVGRFFGLQLMFAVTLLWGYLPQWIPFAGKEARRLMRDWGYESMTGRYKVANSSVDYEKALAESKVPTLCVVFPDDPFVPLTCAEHFVGKLRAADVTRMEIPPEELRLKKTDHFRWVARPQAVADRVSEWTRRENAT
ncbi:alpha/beta fold hydrolase [Streptomyces sp. NPDC087850]|uniref:alpha/beta hydrolase family protein n=1 Tax=unclassified Streptomyces TaxID=2593676 RepID=UPI0037FEE40E